LARESKKTSPPNLFPVLPSLVNAALPPTFFFIQCLAWDAAEVVELWDEVTRARAAVVMVRARAAQAEGMVREKAVLLATAHDEAAGVTQMVSILGNRLAIMSQAKDVAEEKISSLTSEVATANQRREATEE
jgi:hypothetical protein